MSANEPGSTNSRLPHWRCGRRRAGAAAIAGVVARGEVRPEVKTGAHDLVTAADRASEAAIIEVIRAERPDDAILGEESGAHSGSSGSRWLVDPLDGTANFVYGRPDFAVSVGVESAGTIVAGAIIRPSDGRWVLADVSLREIAIGAELSPPQTTKLAGRQHVSAAPNDEAHAADALVSFGLPYAMSARQAALAIIRRPSRTFAVCGSPVRPRATSWRGRTASATRSWDAVSQSGTPQPDRRSSWPPAAPCETSKHPISTSWSRHRLRWPPSSATSWVLSRAERRYRRSSPTHRTKRVSFGRLLSCGPSHTKINFQ